MQSFCSFSCFSGQPPLSEPSFRRILPGLVKHSPVLICLASSPFRREMNQAPAYKSVFVSHMASCLSLTCFSESTRKTMLVAPAFAFSAMVFQSHLLRRACLQRSWLGKDGYPFPVEPCNISRFLDFTGPQCRLSHLNSRTCSHNRIPHSTPQTNNEVNNNRIDLLFETLSSVFRLASQVVCSNFLPSVLISAVLFGLAFPEPGRLAHRVGLSKWATFGVFLLSGLSLRTSELGEALEAWPSLFFGLVSVLFLTPLLATVILQVNLVPQELVTGLAIFCCVPTTLSSGVALTQVAGANTAVALALTVLSNIPGIVTVPFMVSKLVACGIGISIPAGLLMKSLVEALVVPLLLGKVLRDYVRGVGDFINKRGMQCSMLSAICLGIKTLPVAVVIIGRLGNLLGEAGLLVLPCVAAHITQIIIDFFLVRVWVQGNLQNLQTADQ